MQNKRYKLLKWYPSLSTSWEVGMEIGQGDRAGLCANFSPCNIKYPQWQISYDQVVNFPEFWEEIKEVKLEVPIGTKFVVANVESPVYTVTQLEKNWVTIITSGGNIYKYDLEYFNNRFTSGTWTIYKEKEFEVLDEEYFAGHRTSGTSEVKYKINKVKRLSDGVIFKLGDLVKLKNGELKGILRFNIHNTTCQVELSSRYFPDYLANLSEIQPFNQPIFLDELGNEVYEGDNVFGVCPKASWQTNYSNGEGISAKYLVAYNNGQHLQTTSWKYFKNRVDADNYILENKPIFSRKQVRSIINEIFDNIEEFKEGKYYRVKYKGKWEVSQYLNELFWVYNIPHTKECFCEICNTPIW